MNQPHHVGKKIHSNVIEIENCWITLSDKTRLAAKIWMPENAASKPVPAILEYLPYRKRDGTAIRDAQTHSYFAARGYVCIRVDIRGYGESDGLVDDEYVKREQDDGLEIIDWITAQDWCDGKVGMMGISWGGFNGLQIAARQPQALKAIITLCSTDDRYADDIHYKGGNMLMENIGWAATMLSYSTAPPDPMIVGDRWLEMWKTRLQTMPLLLKDWMTHQSRDALWRHGSICEDFSAIKAAVYCVGGWADAYTNSIPRMMESLQCPRKALIGPWIHKYPHIAIPEPRMGFLTEALRWWDYWLKDIDTGIMDEPACTYYQQDAVLPKPNYSTRPGRWVQTNGWPDVENIDNQCWYLSDHGLHQKQQSLTVAKKVDSPLTVGVHGGEYLTLWYGPDYPTDQRRDDAYSVCFDSPPLKNDVQILGNPLLTLAIKSDKSCGQLTARLSDIAPGGEVTRVTYGTINLRNRDAQTSSQTVSPGESYSIHIEMDFIGQTIPKGHQIRISLSSSYFPLLWTAPEKAPITLLESVQSLDMPVFKGQSIDNPFSQPECAKAPEITELRELTNKRAIQEEVATGLVTMDIEDDFGRIKFDDHGLWVDQIAKEHYCAHPDDPNQTTAHTHWQHKTGRDDWQISTDTQMKIHCDKQNFYIEASLIAYHGEQLVVEKRWHETVARISV